MHLAPVCRNRVSRRLDAECCRIPMMLAALAMSLLPAHPALAKDAETTITILHIADLHGQLDPHQELFLENGKVVFRERGGLAHIKTLVDRERQRNPGRTILIDGGDLIQGDGYSVKTQGQNMVEPVVALGYDMVVPGNWEVIYGKGQLLKPLSSFKATTVAENMYHADTMKPMFPGTWIKEVEGIRLGFMGINDPDVPTRQNPKMSEGILFSEPDARLKQRVDQFVAANSIDVMFIVSHLGAIKQVALADSPISERVNYILGNDTHERVRQPLQRKYAKVTEPGAFGTFVGKLDLYFKAGKLVGDRYDLIEVDPARFPADPAMQDAIDRAKMPFKAEMTSVIGRTTTPLYRYMIVENPMDNLITDAFRWKTRTQIALSNGFRYGNPIVPEGGKPAPITVANLYNMMPVNTKLKTGKVLGSDLREWLEAEINNAFSPDPAQRFGGYLVRFSGMQMRFEPSLPKGERIKSLRIGRKPIDLNAFYTVTAVVRGGAPDSDFNRLPNVQSVQEHAYTAHDAIREYLAKHDPVAPALDGRAVSEELGRQSFSTIPGTDYRFR